MSKEQKQADHAGSGDASSLVSILAPCYNEERFLGPFLESVLNQSYAPLELLLVDDASTDRSLEIARSYEPRFAEKGIAYRILSSEQNRGAAAAINLALRHYRGSYLMWADSDDILLPENLSEKVHYLESHPEKDYVLCRMVSVDEHDLRKPTSLWKRTVPDGEDPMVEDLLLARNVLYGTNTVLVRREAFERAIPSNAIYESRQGQNYQLLLPLAYNDHRMAKSIENSIDFAAKRQVWQRMILIIIRPMLIAMSIWQNSHAVLLRSKAARRKAFWLFAII